MDDDATLPGVRLTLLGGALQQEAGVVRDAVTIAQVSARRFDTAVVSCRALHPRLGACEADPDEAALKRAVMHVARRTVLLVDASKLGGTAAHHFADAGAFDVVITDAQAPPGLVAALREEVGEVLIGGPSPASPGARDDVEDALTRAEAMLAVVGGEVGTVRSIRSGPFQVSAPDSVDVSDFGMYDTSTIRKSVGATVSVTFSGR